jgi:tetratricopeptide (TPR) repeat protein
MLGSVYQKQGFVDGALEEYSLSLALDPANVEAYVNRGELLIQKGMFEQAASDFKNAVELDPAGTNPSVNRARALASMTAAALQAALSQG